MISTNYKNKYLKYKNKYLELKRQIGGEPKLANRGEDNYSKYSTDDLGIFLDIISESKEDDLVMIIGYSIIDIHDKDRNLKCDVAMSYHKDEDVKRLEEILNGLEPDKIPHFTLNCNFNKISRVIPSKIGTNKFNKIIFDSSTFKFLTTPLIIFLFYYNLLKVGGSIFIESNPNYFSASEITLENFNKILDDYRSFEITHTNFFIQPYFYNIKEGFIKTLNPARLSEFEKVSNNNFIKENNKNLFQKMLNGSKVEYLFNSDDNPYPIINTKYPITQYYKITKEIESGELPTGTERRNYLFTKSVSALKNAV